MKHLYFCRHGESEDNANEIFGSRSNSPLTELGRFQASIAGKQAAKNGLKFDVIIASPLRRAQETAAIIASYVGNPLIETYSDVIERYVGELEGETYASFYDFHPYKDIDNVLNAETMEQLQERATKVLKYITERPEAIILISSHSAFGRALRRAINNEPWQSEYNSSGKVIPLPNAEIIRFI